MLTNYIPSSEIQKFATLLQENGLSYRNLVRLLRETRQFYWSLGDNTPVSVCTKCEFFSLDVVGSVGEYQGSAYLYVKNNGFSTPFKNQVPAYFLVNHDLSRTLIDNPIKIELYRQVYDDDAS